MTCFVQHEIFCSCFYCFFICHLLKLECFYLAKIQSLHLEQSVVRFGIVCISWESYLKSFVPHVVELVTDVLAVPEVVNHGLYPEHRGVF